MKILNAIALALILMPAAAPAQTTRPLREDDGMFPGRLGMPGELRPRRPRGHSWDPARRDIITEADWARVYEFMKQNSPERLKVMESLSQRRNDVKGMIKRRYDALITLKEKDPPLYDLKLKQLTLDDEIFGLANGIRQRAESEGAISEMRKALDAKIGARLDLELEEREMRAQRLRAELDKFKDELQSTSSREQLVKARADRILKQPATQPTGDQKEPETEHP